MATGGGRLLAPAKLLQLEGVLGVLVDAADGFDMDGLAIDLTCEVHGPSPIPNGTCMCRGERVSAVEFVQALMIDVRSAGQSRRGDHRENSRSGQRQRYGAEAHLAVPA